MPTGLAPEIVHFMPHGLGQQEKDGIGGPDFMVKPQVSTGLHSAAAGWLLSLFSGAAPRCCYLFQQRLSVSASTLAAGTCAWMTAALSSLSQACACPAASGAVPGHHVSRQPPTPGW